MFTELDAIAYLANRGYRDGLATLQRLVHEKHIDRVPIDDGFFYDDKKLETYVNERGRPRRWVRRQSSPFRGSGNGGGSAGLLVSASPPSKGPAWTFHPTEDAINIFRVLGETKGMSAEQAFREDVNRRLREYMQNFRHDMAQTIAKEIAAEWEPG